MFIESFEESATGGKSFKMESKLSRAEFKLFFGDLFGAADVLSPEMLRDDSCCKAASNDSGILGGICAALPAPSFLVVTAGQYLNPH